MGYTRYNITQLMTEATTVIIIIIIIIIIVIIIIIIIYIIDTETAMMHRLQSVLMEHSDALISVIECTTELDWLANRDVHIHNE